MLTLADIMLIAAGIMLLACCVSAVVCRYSIQTVVYHVRLPGLKRRVRTALIADLHSREFGRENKRLLELLKQVEPEYIFACGDIIGRDAGESDIARMTAFLGCCSELAPTGYVRGNHETGLIWSDYPDLLERIAEKCTVVNDSCTEISLGNLRVTLGGTKGSHGYLTRPDGQSCPMLDDALQKKLPVIIMSHKPDAVISSKEAQRSGALFLCGHTHGGLWRLPLIGGLTAPGQGFFPKYDRGYFEFENNTRMIITAGMHGYGPVPRLFNRPELTVIVFEP